MARQRPDRIPRRTAEIELWDTNPVGTRDAWRRELLQFWSLVATRGKRIGRRASLGLYDPALGKGRSLLVSEIAALLAHRIRTADGAMVSAGIEDDLRFWLADTIVVPGEKSGRRGPIPAAGLSIPSYAGLILFNRSATRERFWASMLWNLLASDFAFSELTSSKSGVSLQLDRFLGMGLGIDYTAKGPRTTWAGIMLDEVADADPETYLAYRALTTPGADELGSAAAGLGEDFLRGSTDGATLPQLLCPGSAILARRSLSLLLGQQGSLGHAALSDLVETALTFHAALYFVRGMHVLNELVARRRLPEDCRVCWDKYQGDVRPVPSDADRLRWQRGEYQGAGDAGSAADVEGGCHAEDLIFLNAGRKEDAAAKDLGRVSLEHLRRELATYTVNRIFLSITADLAGRLAPQFEETTPPLDRVLERMDAWGADPGKRGTVAYAWTLRIQELKDDPAIPGIVVEQVPDRIAAAGGDPHQLEAILRDLVSEGILSSRAFTRYIELLHSLLGGGPLPTNQDPKGMMARGGSKTVNFHMSLNDRVLELLVALAALEARERPAAIGAADDDPSSFAGFLRFVERRFHLSVQHPPSGEEVPGGLVAAAAAESVAALRTRLASMGLLEEYSDSSEWNRITWGKDR